MRSPALFSALIQRGTEKRRHFARARVCLACLMGYAASGEVISSDSQVARALAGQAGKGLRVTAMDGGARLRCAFQKMDAEATPAGLWLTSLSGAVPDRFQIRATRVGRGGEYCELPEHGAVSVEDQTVVWARTGLIEEYAVSMDGVRQDFVVTTRPAGSAPLQLDLAARGCQVSGDGEGALLTLAESGRGISYHRLHVTDAAGRVLQARMTAPAPDRLVITVEDAEAVYPVRIDPTFADADWNSLGGLPGINFGVNAAAVDSTGRLYLGGGFTVAGSTEAQNIVMWDGSTWSALGDGLSGTVYSLAVDSGDQVYATGNFSHTASGALVLNGVGKWNGTEWVALGTGLGGTFPHGRALAVDDSDHVYVGGLFSSAGGVTSPDIAKWDGSAWSALGNGSNGTVSAVAVHGADVYVGGTFSAMGVVSANKVARWDGSAWSAMGSGLGGTNQTVNSLTVSSGGTVYAAGSFTSSGGLPVNGIAEWSGTVWNEVGGGLDGPATTAAFDGAGNLYVGGGFDTAGAVSAKNIAKWNFLTTTWTALDTGADNSVQVIVSDADGGVFAGGSFMSAGSTGARSIAHWDGAVWSALHTGINDGVLAFAMDSAGRVYAGGDFVRAGSTLASHVAMWDGSTWAALGTGVNGKVLALAVDASDDLYVAGEFTQAGGASASRVAKWDGSAWSALADGLDDRVSALALDGDGNLYAGGTFLNSGAAPMSRVAMWNGTGWSALGTGASSGAVNALLWSASTSTLYAGGSFTVMGGVTVNRVARWNGTAWSALGQGFNGTVNALALSPGGALHAGGAFTQSGTQTRNRVARWTGSSWAALGSGNGGTIHTMAFDISGTLYVGGSFSSAGGEAANNIAHWNGVSWFAIGSGTNLPVHALLAHPAGRLYAGGYLSLAGDKVSGYAAWLDIAAPEIAIFNGISTAPADERIDGSGFWDFGTQGRGTTSAPQTFTIKNVGSASLTGLAVALDENWDDVNFTLTQPPLATLLPGESTTFTVSFAPQDLGDMFGVVQILNNDENESPFLIAASGSGIWTIQQWRQFYFGTTENTGNAANNFDPNFDGVPNVIAYALGLHPLENSAHLLPVVDPGDFEIGWLSLFVDEGIGVVGVSIGAEISETLEPESWTPATEYGGGPYHYLSEEIGMRERLFIRLTVAVEE